MPDLTAADKRFLRECGIVLAEDPPKVERKAAAIAVREWPNERSCTCFLGHPPCSFCESYDPDADDESEEARR